LGQFVAGDVVVLPFPFSNLSEQKRRPAVVLVKVDFGDLILCQVTSKAYSSKLALTIGRTDFASGGLPVTSYARPDKLFTIEPTIVTRTAGKLQASKLQEILARVRQLFT
jgi:mRNA interferase MazF